MKYRIEGEYKDHHMEGSLQLTDGELNDVKDFVMHGLPSLMQDLYEKIGANLKEEAEGNKDKIIGVMALIGLMAQNRVSEYLTESLNKMLGDEDDDEEGVEVNPREILHG